MHIQLKNQDYYLFLIWIFHSLLILLLSYINPNHYTTVDSHYYLESASNLLSGKGYSIVENNSCNWNSTFPIGYSLTISCASFLTHTNVLIASKLVNIAASGIWLMYLKRRFGREKSVILSAILFLGCFLKLWAHTWSEPLFLVILFCWTFDFYLLNRHSQISKSTFCYLFFLGISLIAIRYAGIFIIPLTLVFCFKHFQRNNYIKAKVCAGLTFGWATFFILYLLLNKYKSVDFFGGERFDGNIQIIGNLITFSKGLLNEILISDINFEVFSFLSIAGMAIQTFAIILYCFQKIKNLSSLTIYFWIIAAGYFFFLFTARLFSPFDDPGYRLLAPFSFLFLSGFCLILEFDQFSKRMKYASFTLIIFSWLDLIPRQNFNIKLQQVFSAISDII